MLINLYRVMHGAPPLFWNDQLEKESQAWAEQLAQKGTLEHDTSMKDGENIAKLPASNSDVMNAVDAWYDEEKMFDYKNPGFSKATGHFTQVNSFVIQSKTAMLHGARKNYSWEARC